MSVLAVTELKAREGGTHDRPPGVPVAVDKCQARRSDGIIAASVDILHIGLSRDRKVLAGRVGLLADLGRVFES